MFGIGDFFKRIQGGFAKELFLRKAIADAVKKCANIDVAVEDMSVKDGIVNLNKISQAARSVIFIKKQAILAEINGQQAGVLVKDIR